MKTNGNTPKPSLEEQQTTLVDNWTLFETQALRLQEKDPQRFSGIKSVLSKIQGAAIAAPASTRYEYVCAYPGGLVEHSLRVVANMARLREAFALNGEISLESLLVTGLFHDIGKIGVEKFDFYLPETSEWHREKLGQTFNINPKLAHLSVPQMSLQWFAKNGVDLTQDEWYAISTVRSRATETVQPGQDNRPTGDEPILSVILGMAVKMACIQGKNKRFPSTIST